MATDGQAEDCAARDEGSEVQDDSTGVSEAPMCRICFRDANTGPLLSPCNCRGSIGLVHRACLEEWLSARNTTECSICSYQFKVERRPRSVWEWLCDSSTRVNRWYIVVDTSLSVFGAVMLLVSAWMSAAEIMNGVSSILGCFLIASIVVLAGIICVVDIYLMIRHHSIALVHWRQNNWKIHVVLPDEDVSAAPQAGPSSLAAPAPASSSGTAPVEASTSTEASLPTGAPAPAGTPHPAIPPVAVPAAAPAIPPATDPGGAPPTIFAADPATLPATTSAEGATRAPAASISAKAALPPAPERSASEETSGQEGDSGLRRRQVQ